MNRFLAKRKALHLGQEDAARAADMSVYKLHRIEHDKQPATVADLVQLAKAYGCTTGELAPELLQEEEEAHAR